MNQKIKQDDISIGKNIRRIRKARGIGQTELAIKLQLVGIDSSRNNLGRIIEVSYLFKVAFIFIV